MCPAERPDRATTGYRGTSSRWDRSFLFPCVGAIVDLVLFSVAHNYDLATEGFLTFLDEMSETIAYPVHLVGIGFEIGFGVVWVLMHVDIVELRLGRGIRG